MRVKVIEKFADKNTGQIYEVGTEAEFSEKRVKEILSTGQFIEAIEEPKAEEVKEEKTEEVKEEKTEEKPKAKSTKKKSAKK